MQPIIILVFTAVNRDAFINVQISDISFGIPFSVCNSLTHCYFKILVSEKTPDFRWIGLTLEKAFLYSECIKTAESLGRY